MISSSDRAALFLDSFGIMLINCRVQPGSKRLFGKVVAV